MSYLKLKGQLKENLLFNLRKSDIIQSDPVEKSKGRSFNVSQRNIRQLKSAVTAVKERAHDLCDSVSSSLKKAKAKIRKGHWRTSFIL